MLSITPVGCCGYFKTTITHLTDPCVARSKQRITRKLKLDGKCINQRRCIGRVVWSIGLTQGLHGFKTGIHPQPISRIRSFLIGGRESVPVRHPLRHPVSFPVARPRWFQESDWLIFHLSTGVFAITKSSGLIPYDGQHRIKGCASGQLTRSAREWQRVRRYRKL